jgi:Mor family transcriptional regulator
MARDYDVLIIVQRELLEAGARHGLSQHQTADIAACIDEALRRELGATYPYIPCPDKGERNRRICAAVWDGEPIAGVARRFGLSEWHTRCIVRDGRAGQTGAVENSAGAA